MFYLLKFVRIVPSNCKTWMTDADNKFTRNSYPTLPSQRNTLHGPLTTAKIKNNKKNLCPQNIHSYLQLQFDNFQFQL